jgi:hypothetical protein
MDGLSRHTERPSRGYIKAPAVDVSACPQAETNITQAFF